MQILAFAFSHNGSITIATDVDTIDMPRQNENLGCLAALMGLGAKVIRSRSSSQMTFESRVEDDPPDAKLTYLTRDDFLSQAEATFYRTLQKAVGNDAVVFAKVGMGDVLFVPKGANEFAARNKISHKHFDFILCEPRTFKVLLAIELDDRSHARKANAERDAQKDLAANSAGLPLQRVPIQSTYDPAVLRAEIVRMLGGSTSTSGPAPSVAIVPSADETVADPPTNEAPLCPKCNIPMKLRQSRNNPSGAIHQSFFGCENYPRCRETRPYSAGITKS